MHQKSTQHCKSTICQTNKQTNKWLSMQTPPPPRKKSFFVLWVDGEKRTLWLNSLEKYQLKRQNFFVIKCFKRRGKWKRSTTPVCLWRRYWAGTPRAILSFCGGAYGLWHVHIYWTTERFFPPLSLGIPFGKYWDIIIFLNGKSMDKWLILEISKTALLKKEIVTRTGRRVKILLVGHASFEIFFLIKPLMSSVSKF